MVLNKSLQVCYHLKLLQKVYAKLPLGSERAEYECRIGGADVQELPVQCLVSP